MFRLVCMGVTVLISVSGCAALYKRDIRYGLDDVATYSGGPLNHQTLGVRELADERPDEIVRRQGSVDAAAVVERAGDDWYFNSDDHYKVRPVVSAITGMLVEHLAAAKLFKTAKLASDTSESDLILEGAVEYFEAYRDREVGKQALISQMGLIGLVIAATDKSPYKARVVLSLKLRRGNDGATLWAGQVEETQKGEEPISTSSLEVYRHANDALKTAINRLLEQLSRLDLPSDTPRAVSLDAIPP